jgi:hypothetical protein
VAENDTGCLQDVDDSMKREMCGGLIEDKKKKLGMKLLTREMQEPSLSAIEFAGLSLLTSNFIGLDGREGLSRTTANSTSVAHLTTS